MTSLAVFSPLKRTITDIMEDDLYHLPNNSGSSFNVNNVQQQQQSQQQQQPAGRMNSFGSQQQQPVNYQQSSSQQFPFQPSQQVTQQPTPTLTSAQLNSMFNSLPDSYITPYSLDMNDQQQSQQHSNIITPEQVFSGTVGKSPFADYANPDSQFGTFFGNNTVNNTTSNVPSTRRRFTTLESHSNEKPIKDEDYYLFNTDIQPSHLVSKNDEVNLSNDDFLYLNTPLYVPPKQTQEFPIPGYENDYLMMSGVEDFEEDIEDPISSDEEDEDDYFHDDFDEMIMNDLPQPLVNDFVQNQQQVHPQVQQFEQEQMSHRPSSISSSSLTSVPTTGSTYHDNSSFDRLVFSSQENMPSVDDIKLDDDEDDEDYGNTQETTPEQDFESSPVNSIRKLHNHFEASNHQTAAEITANNPNHQCDLINPSTSQPCNKQFSRPYDLIRHQETIHASKKKIFRCVICEGRLNGGPGNGKSKTFSRGDALSRHIKVKHGLVGDEAIELINDAKANVEFISV
ncbi:transcriptional regulator Rpn4p [[Candida] railenensis]|uniref:Transcriptional regulator Rpn4p n=1 Tax=[Candida] railenensis TaxID=45579 RepID=A0A9P0QT83_9ASCO|nr:transcriptional regulator Rpn4p [[Candida] railenensis]